MIKLIQLTKPDGSTQIDQRDRNISAEKSEKYNNQYNEDAENLENYSEEKEFKQMKNTRKQTNYSPYSLEDINTFEARVKPDFEEDKVVVEFVNPESVSAVQVFTDPEDSEPVYSVEDSLLLQPEFNEYTQAIQRTGEEQSVWGFIGKCIPFYNILKYK